MKGKEELFKDMFGFSMDSQEAKDARYVLDKNIKGFL